MARFSQGVWCAVVLLCASACGGSKPPADEPAVEPMDEVEQKNLSEAKEPTDSSPAPIGTMDQPPVGDANDYEITQRDCNTLTAKYEELLRKDEIAKLDKKGYDPKLYDSARKQVEKVIQQGTDDWRQQCESIVGSVQSHRRLTCANKAKELARFNGCMDGKFDNEAAEDE